MSASNNATDDEIRRYLLGQTPATGQGHLEERLVVDADFFERVEMVEDQLVDDYVSDALSATERASFEQNYLVTPERHERIKNARVLRQLLTEEQRERSEPVHNGARLPRWNSAWLVAFACLIVSIAVIAYGAMHVSRIRESAAKRERELRHGLAKQAQMQQQLQNELRDARNGPGSVLTFLLTPDLSLRGETPTSDTQELLVPAHAVVQLQLAVDLSEVRRPVGYRSILANSAGRQVWGTNSLAVTGTGERRTIALRLPAGVLASGRYRLTLFGTTTDGGMDELETYTFRVVQR